VSDVLNYLLSGGSFRRGIADRLHSVIWARRLYGGRSDAPEMRLLNDIDLHNLIAVDVGAHAGNWSLNLSQRVGRDGLVIAYEALPHYGRAMSLAMKLLRAKNVRVRSVAVGDSEKTISLRWRGDDNQLLTGRTHIESSGQTSTGVVQVPMVTLDRDLVACKVEPSRVAFVKIDVEGAELEVLRGAANLLNAGHPAVYLEAEPQWLSRFGHSVGDVFQEMSRYGYNSFLVSDSGIIPTDVDAYLEQYESGSGSNNVLFLITGSPLGAS
jgi:FkbM family methyltransferase